MSSLGIFFHSQIIFVFFHSVSELVWWYSSVVEYLLCIYEALISIPSTLSC